VGVFVYLPDDEPREHRFNGDLVKLRPGTTEIMDDGNISAAIIAHHLAAKLESWGVCVLDGPVVDGKATSPEDQKRKDKADRKYLASTFQWAHTILLNDSFKRGPSLTLGVKVPPSDEAKKAQAWLDSHKADLVKNGILAE
jgi:hypothetical protein